MYVCGSGGGGQLYSLVHGLFRRCQVATMYYSEATEFQYYYYNNIYDHEIH
jgi:hypothetical protein